MADLRVNYPNTGGDASKFTGQDAIAVSTRVNENSAAIQDLDDDLAAKVDKSLVGAKGDMLIGSAPGSVGVVPAAGIANGQVWTRDSAAPLGAKWATPTGGGGGSSAGLVVDGDGFLAFDAGAVVDGGAP